MLESFLFWKKIQVGKLIDLKEESDVLDWDCEWCIRFLKVCVSKGVLRNLKKSSM